MTKKIKKHNSNFEGPFVAIPKNLLNSVAYRNLNHHAQALFIYMSAIFNGSNNGDISATFKYMKKYGWRSSSTLHDAKEDLKKWGLIIETRQGGKNKCSLYAVTYRNIDFCGGKIDINPTTHALNTWKKFEPLPDIKQSQNKVIELQKIKIIKEVTELNRLSQN